MIRKKNKIYIVFIRKKHTNETNKKRQEALEVK